MAMSDDDPDLPILDDADPVTCAGCGRAYAAARFAGGRTFVCACGSRVGRRRARGFDDPPRFAADSMLGGLARSLRALGYDTTWESPIDDALLVRRAVGENRILLTRDVGIGEEWWMDGLVLLASDDPAEQLREVARLFALYDAAAFTRCSRCNAVLEPVSADDAESMDAVPPAVIEAGLPLARCPACERLYWEGSHTRRMRDDFSRALGRSEGG
jgi:uncharacterized protein with PIN domain